jgi:hypothetical protein
MRVRVVAAASVTVAVLLLGLRTNAQPVPSAQKSDGEKALIYVYRETSIIGIANFDVSFLHVDGHRVTRVRGGYVPLMVSPGQHKLITKQSLWQRYGQDSGTGDRYGTSRSNHVPAL